MTTLYHIVTPKTVSPFVFTLEEAVRRASKWQKLTNVQHGVIPCNDYTDDMVWTREAFDEQQFSTEELRQYVLRLDGQRSCGHKPKGGSI